MLAREGDTGIGPCSQCVSTAEPRSVKCCCRLLASPGHDTALSSLNAPLVPAGLQGSVLCALPLPSSALTTIINAVNGSR